MTQLRELDDGRIRRIGIIKPSAFGDVVQTLPILPVLKERFPEVEIAWVIRRELSPLLAGHPQLDDVIPYDRHGGVRGTWRLMSELKARAFDLVFDLQGLFRTGLMTWATKAPYRVGLQSAREGSRLACNITLADTGRMVPAHIRYWRVAEALGLGDRQRISFIHTSIADDSWAARQVSELEQPCLAIHPGARWETKRWPVENFAVVAAKAYRRFGFSMAILGSGEERPAAEELETLLRRFIPAARIANLAGETSIKQLAALLKQVDLVLTNDSGPMHLAAAVNTPVVGVFTCTDPARSGPPGDEHALITTDMSCRACYKKRCPLKGKNERACLTDITADQVWSRFEALVQRHARRDRVA